jgi:asparagine synthetase B (glutamine-hydrolysing)
MLEEIAHRGPDAMGIWVSDKIAFGNLLPKINQ